ncbi:ParA family protein [Marihabitans asiaticum]|uniref:Cellulose biosynthesis protein BcsQ n=1 Tax=Marihabitans asiaticum TaxID=415218 RepID=A0A560WDY1_9MICO|nr:ParA family protein [Marihabitans asiaticum]TWD15838.1 cellulose biosynthesis protein BcsQ [Marihabitans asiaticum]
MIAVAVCSLKGGVGKTTVTLGLTSAALTAGLRVLVLDLDPQGDATAGLDAAGEIPSTLAKVVDDPRRRHLQACTVPSRWTDEGEGGEPASVIDVAVGGEQIAQHDRTDLSSRRLLSLRTVLAKVAKEDRYDLVVIDCPPSLGGLTRMGLAAADRVVVVTEPGVFAIAAADRALRAVHDVRSTLKVPVQPLGILVNRVRGHLAEHSYRVEELRSLFGPLVMVGEIPERTAVQRAQGAFAPVHRLKDPGGRQVASIFDALLQRALRSRS